MEGVNTKGLMKAVQQLAGQAVAEVQEEERRDAYAQYQQPQQQNLYCPPYSPLYGQNTIAAAANTWVGQTTAGSTTLGGGFNVCTPSTQYATISTGYAKLSSPSITFTDEQMSLFMEKLTHLLSKGWECLRCHRIWNPRETGCEFCNFIDRLEGKEVERDTAA
jgi:hypothetical protein